MRDRVIFIGGFADGIFRPVRDYCAAFRRDCPGLDVAFYPWTAGAAVVAELGDRRCDARISIVGHSYGADTALRAVAALRATGQGIDTLITIDPVGRRLRSALLPHIRQACRLWYNVSARGGPALEWSNLVARVGGPYGDAPRAYAHAFVNARATHRQFGRMMDDVHQPGIPAAVQVLLDPHALAADPGGTGAPPRPDPGR